MRKVSLIAATLLIAGAATAASSFDLGLINRNIDVIVKKVLLGDDVVTHLALYFDEDFTNIDQEKVKLKAEATAKTAAWAPNTPSSINLGLGVEGTPVGKVDTANLLFDAKIETNILGLVSYWATLMMQDYDEDWADAEERAIMPAIREAQNLRDLDHLLEVFVKGSSALLAHYVEDMARLRRELAELNPEDPDYDWKKEDLESDIRANRRAQEFFMILAVRPVRNAEEVLVGVDFEYSNKDNAVEWDLNAFSGLLTAEGFTFNGSMRMDIDNEDYESFKESLVEFLGMLSSPDDETKEMISELAEGYLNMVKELIQGDIN